jgi:ADP-ribose pyrophosphatase YjhB (NUDIX family)
MKEVLLAERITDPYKGKLNGVGGKLCRALDELHSNHSHHNIMKNCAIREIKEETGVQVNNIKYITTSAYPGEEVWVYSSLVNKEDVKQMEGMKLDWFRVDLLLLAPVTINRLAGYGAIQFYINRIISTKEEI